MRKSFTNPTTTKFLLALLLIVIGAGTLSAQMNYRLEIYQVRTTIGDCDGWPFGDSDPAWWWTGPGIVDDQCHQAGCNGCTESVSIDLVDENYVCQTDVPASVSVRFRGCEDDGAGCIAGAFAGICDGSAGDRTDVIGFPGATPGTYNIGPFAVNSTGCSGTWTYWARWVVSGSFTSPPAHDAICAAAAITVGAPAATFNNACATVEVGEPDPADGSISPSNTTWHTFIAPASGHVIVSTDHAGTTFDTEIAVYEEIGPVCPGPNFANLVEIGSDDDIIVLINESSELELECLTPGATYYIQMDGNDASDFGNYQISVSSVGPALPTNDDICSATALGALPFGGSLSITNQNNFCATFVGEPTPSAWGGDQTVWYTFTTAASPGQNTLIQGINSGSDDIDLQLALYESSTGTCAGVLTEVDSDYDPILFGEDLDIKCLNPSTTYFLQVDGSVIPLTDLHQGIFDITVTDDGTPRAPNDLMCNATSLGTIPDGGASSLTNQNNYCAGVEVGEPTPVSWAPDQTVWYSFTPPTSGNVMIELTNSGSDDIDLQVALYESDNDLCTGAFTLLEDKDNVLGFSIDGTDALVYKCLDTNKTYFLQVDGWPEPITGWLVEGIFDISVEDYAPSAPNDSICSAIPLGNPNPVPVGLTNQNNFCADNILEPIPTAFGTNKTVWYTFIAPPTGRVTVTIDSDPPGSPRPGDGLDVQIAVYALDGDSCAGAPTEIKSEYDDILELGDDESMYVTCLEPGREYWIMVDGASGPNAVDGFFDITVNEEPGPAPITNDDLCDATDLGAVPASGSVASMTEHNFCATVEPGEPVPAAFGLDQTVWYCFEAPPSGNININMVTDPLALGDDIDLQVAVYESSTDSCDGVLSEIDSDYDPVFFDEDLYVDCLEPGKKYFVQVDGANIPLLTLHEGYFGITISEAPAYTLFTNDDICNAQDIGIIPFSTIVGPTPGSNYCATEETGEPNVSGTTWIFDFTYDETVWYTFTTNGSPGNIIVTIDNTVGIDANINIYQNLAPPSCAFGDLLQVASGDNLLSSDVSVVLPCPEPNTEYYVQVDGLDLIGDQGTFDITVTDDGTLLSPALNDDICNAVALGAVPSGGSTPLTAGSNICAGEEAGEPNVSGSALLTDPAYDETVWFTFTTPATPGDITVEVINTVGIDANITVYHVEPSTSCDFADLTEVDDADNLLSGDVSLLLQCLRPNSTYYIQVDGLDLIGDEGTFDIRVSDNGIPGVYAPYDSICNAGVLGVVPSGGATATISTNNFCAGEEAGEPNVSGGSVVTDPNYDETVWFTFTTSATPGLTTIDVFNTAAIDAGITVYSASPMGSCNFADLTEISSADDLLSFDVSLDIPCLDPNTTYYVQVDGLDLIGDEGTFDIRVSDDGGAAAFPPHDSICNAMAMGVVPSGGSTPVVSSNNFCAKEEPGEPNVSGGTVITDPGYDETVWFTFTTSATPGTFTVDITNAVGIQASLNAYEVSPAGSCNFADLTYMRGNTALLPGSDVTLELVCLDPNTTYYVQLDGVDILGDNGTFDIQVSDDGTPVAAPLNDSICFAVPLGDPTGGAVGPVAGNNNCAGVEPGEPGVSANDETVWYTFIAPTSGRAEIIVNSVAYIDANFSIYHDDSSGCDLSEITQIGSNHDNLVSFSVDHTEECLIPGDRYYVQIDGGDLLGDYGDFTIEVRDAAPAYVAPPNDSCGGAIPLTVQSESCQGTGAWQTFNYGNPTVSISNSYTQSCGDNCGDTWYCFTMPASGSALVEGNDEYGPLGITNSEVTIIAYRGTCSSLTPIDCDQGGFLSDPGFYVSGTPGEKIWLQVFDDGGDDFGETFGLCVSDRCGSDNCLTAQFMMPGIPYCWDTDGAGGETSPTDPGYLECGGRVRSRCFCLLRI